MSAIRAIPVLFCWLVGAVLALVAWGWRRSQSQMIGDSVMGSRGDVLVALLILAAFALGVFLTYMLLGLNF
jgi:hypothetical protein